VFSELFRQRGDTFFTPNAVPKFFKAKSAASGCNRGMNSTIWGGFFAPKCASWHKSLIISKR